jgi:hypothetical protein
MAPPYPGRLNISKKTHATWGKEARRMLEWILRLFHWLAKPVLMLTGLEQPPVRFDLI